MPRSLVPIVGDTAITEKGGAITEFFRLAWEALRSGFASSPTAGLSTSGTVPASAALTTVAVFTTLSAGFYRFTYYFQKITADGVNSSLQMTLGWTSKGVPQTKVFTALTTDTIGAYDGATFAMNADALTDITQAVAYSSNTPGNMTYYTVAAVEQMI